MTTSSTLADGATCAVPDARSSWPVAGLLLDALTRRDFAGMRVCLDDRVRFRALTPPGLVELDTADDVIARFTTWFGGDDAFEVLDASVGQVGSRLYARWTVRLTPPGDPGAARIAEQHVYTRGQDRIESLDLLCSGFHHENGAAS
ncbi:nuclear transport factor 2 family protein [Nocardioides marmoriginsengisoli]|uniref:Nuclear transport factor 2 family protein n=1 Tax=Nocardioides marmoriginsengisoli TaxID=661483 RepID=A0A3N0CKD4_9ACTN|nr:nuclear transport factor 2 family protein [Nocardioides marmoriginsengisoli]RNL63789.1 nuclear transport factor 2 family protein [Nocardioides marmoriginsengisoli]